MMNRSAVSNSTPQEEMRKLIYVVDVSISLPRCPCQNKVAGSL
jgi:hypothetical protein